MTEELSKEVQEKISQLQILQQRMQVFVAQKQQFQLQQAEVENAIEELKSAKKATYKLVGEVLIEKDKKELEKELAETQEKLAIRIKSLEKQEKATHEAAMNLQKEVTEALK